MPPDFVHSVFCACLLLFRPCLRYARPLDGRLWGRSGFSARHGKTSKRYRTEARRVASGPRVPSEATQRQLLQALRGGCRWTTRCVWSCSMPTLRTDGSRVVFGIRRRICSYATREPTRNNCSLTQHHDLCAAYVASVWCGGTPMPSVPSHWGGRPAALRMLPSGALIGIGVAQFASASAWRRRHSSDHPLARRRRGGFGPQCCVSGCLGHGGASLPARSCMPAPTRDGGRHASCRVAPAAGVQQPGAPSVPEIVARFSVTEAPCCIAPATAGLRWMQRRCVPRACRACARRRAAFAREGGRVGRRSALGLRTRKEALLLLVCFVGDIDAPPECWATCHHPSQSRGGGSAYTHCLCCCDLSHAHSRGC